MRLDLGLIQVYTGEGKGKSTAAIGQGVRSAGNNLKVYMVQFLKSRDTGELKALDSIDNFTVFRFEKPRGFFWNLSDKEILELKSDIAESMSFIKRVVADGECDVLILDEIMGALSNNLVSTDELVSIVSSRPSHMEIILTGRNAPESIISIADYVSHVEDIKHPFEKGIPARRGIEY